MEPIYGGPYKPAPLRPGVSQADAEGIARRRRLLWQLLATNAQISKAQLRTLLRVGWPTLHADLAALEAGGLIERVGRQEFRVLVPYYGIVDPLPARRRKIRVRRVSYGA